MLGTKGQACKALPANASTWQTSWPWSLELGKLKVPAMDELSTSSEVFNPTQNAAKESPEITPKTSNPSA